VQTVTAVLMRRMLLVPAGIDLSQAVLMVADRLVMR